MTATAGVGSSGLEFDGSIDSTDEVGATGEAGSEEYAAKILRIMLWMMENNRDAMKNFFEVLADGDKNKAAHMMEVLEKNLEQLKKQERMKGLKIFLKILGVFALILSAIMVLINPTPFAVAMLVIAVTMFLEPMIANATGNESLVGQAFKEIFNVLKDMGLPVWAAAIIMAVVVVAIMVLTAMGAAALGRVMADVGSKFVQMLRGTSAANVAAGQGAGVSGAVVKAVDVSAKAIDDFLLALKNFVTENMRKIVFAADMTSLAGMNAGELTNGVLKYQVSTSQVSIDKLMAFIDLVTQGLDLSREDAISFKKLISDYVKQIEKMNLV